MKEKNYQDCDENNKYEYDSTDNDSTNEEIYEIEDSNNDNDEDYEIEDSEYEIEDSDSKEESIIIKKIHKGKNRQIIISDNESDSDECCIKELDDINRNKDINYGNNNNYQKIKGNNGNIIYIIN